MKKILLTLFTLYIGSFAFSQDVKIFHISDLNTDISGTEVEVVGDPTDSKIYYDMRVVNLTGDPMEMRFQRKRTADSGRSDEICDDQLCYTADDQFWYMTPSSSVIDHEDTSLFKPQIVPSGIESCGIHDYYIYANGVVYDSIRIKFRTQNQNCFLNVESMKDVLNEFNIFPNPAQKSINLELPSNFKGELLIYDALGNEVQNTNVDSFSSKLDISRLRNGIYFVRLKSENDTISKPKKLIVKN